MNECFITIKNSDSYIYYETEAKTAKEAYQEYTKKLESARVNDDNVNYGRLVLRDATHNFDTIDIYYMGEADPNEKIVQDIRVIMKQNPNRTPENDKRLKKMIMAMFEED